MPVDIPKTEKTVLSVGELNRIKASLLPKLEDNPKEARKAQLKALSDARTKNWSNTLEGLRRKKENFMKEYRAQEELARQEVDRQEAEYRKNLRMQTIQRANDLLYDQTDKMKSLKSQIMYAEVIHERKAQVAFKQKVKEDEKLTEQKYHEETMRQVAEGNAVEEIKAAKVKQSIREIAKTREEQRQEVRLRREREAEEHRRIGIAMREEAQKQLDDAVRQQEEKQQYIARVNEEMVRANEQLKQIREETKRREAAAEAVRDSEKEEIESRKKALKILEARRFEKQQETRTKLIEAAIEQLKLKGDHEDKVLHRQQEEIRERQEKQINDKAAKQKQIREDLAKSREEQIQAKELREKEKRKEEELMIKKWHQENEEAIVADKEKEIQSRVTVKQLKAIIYAEAAEKQKQKISQRIATIEQERVMNSLMNQDENKFKEICAKKIVEFEIQGKPVYTIYRALETTAPQLIPAKLNKQQK